MVTSLQSVSQGTSSSLPFLPSTAASLAATSLNSCSLQILYRARPNCVRNASVYSPRVDDYETSLYVIPGHRITTVWVQAPDGLDPRVSQVLWLWILPNSHPRSLMPEVFEKVLLLALTHRFESCGPLVTYETTSSFDLISLFCKPKEENIVFFRVT